MHLLVVDLLWGFFEQLRFPEILNFRLNLFVAVNNLRRNQSVDFIVGYLYALARKLCMHDRHAELSNNFLLNNCVNGRLGFRLLNSDWLNEDTAPDFVTESDRVASLQPEVGFVFARLIRGGELHLPHVVFTGLHRSRNLLIDCTQLVATCFDEPNVVRPGNFAIVTEGPLLTEYLSRFDRMPITDAAFDEASLEPRFPLLVFTIVRGAADVLLSLRFLLDSSSGHISLLAFRVVTDKLVGSLGSFTDFE